MKEVPDHIKVEIKQRFARLASAPHEEETFPVGPASAKRLGYDAREIDALLGSVTESFAGVGNPLALGELRLGESVLDLGAGAGLDSILAARRVGPTGKVIGVDFAAEMVEKAKRNAGVVGVANAEFLQGEADGLHRADVPRVDRLPNVTLDAGRSRHGAQAALGCWEERRRESRR